jgi:hypothetical protein
MYRNQGGEKRIRVTTTTNYEEDEEHHKRKRLLEDPCLGISRKENNPVERQSGEDWSCIAENYNGGYTNFFESPLESAKASCVNSVDTQRALYTDNDCCILRLAGCTRSTVITLPSVLLECRGKLHVKKVECRMRLVVPLEWKKWNKHELANWNHLKIEVPLGTKVVCSQRLYHKLGKWRLSSMTWTPVCTSVEHWTTMSREHLSEQVKSMLQDILPSPVSYPWTNPFLCVVLNDGLTIIPVLCNSVVCDIVGEKEWDARPPSLIPPPI